LLEEAEKLRVKKPQKALEKVEEALALSITEKNKLNEAKCYLLLAKINQQIEEWELAKQQYTYANTLLDTTTYLQSPERQEALNGLAKTNTKLNNYPAAISNLNTSYNSIQAPKEKANVGLSLADAYFKNQAYDSALIALENSERILKEVPDNSLKSREKAIRAKVLANRGDLKEAKLELDTSLSLVSGYINTKKGTNDIFYKYASEDISTAYFDLNNKNANESYSFQFLDKAEQSLTSSIYYDFIKSNPLELIKYKRALSDDLVKKGEETGAIKELEEVLTIADSLNNDQELAITYRGLAETWLKKGDQTQALKYYQDYGEAMERVVEKKQLKQEEKESILKKQGEILSLSKDLALDESKYELQSASNKLQDLLISGLSLLLVVSVISSILIYRNAQKSKSIGQLLLLKSLRTQMNPHFIFNALNSVNQFIAKNDERAANKFLAEFSKLMRLVLDSSQEDFITLAQEQKLLSLYLKLEHYRFRDKFQYEFHIDEEIALENIEIPPMLIQPYIENAIWHGLRYKEEMGNLRVAIRQVTNTIEVEITDDGIGRKKSAELKTAHQKSHQSTGLKTTMERMGVINEVYHKDYSVEVNDLFEDGTGTKVILRLQK